MMSSNNKAPVKHLARLLIVTVFSIVFFVTTTNLSWSQDEDEAKSEKTGEEESPRGFGVAIGPSTIRLKGFPGEPQEVSVRVWNHGVKPITVYNELSDVANRVDEGGRLSRTFPPPGTVPFSCAQWITLHETEFVVAPKGHRDVSFIVAPPPGAEGGKAGIVFFKVVPTVDGTDMQATATVVIQPRMASLIFFEIEGTVQRTGQLIEMAYETPKEENPLKIKYEFENTGNTDILISGTFHILDVTKALIAKGKLHPLRTFPGDRGAGETQWSGLLPPGNYELLVTLELGPDAQEVIMREFTFSIE
jgi:hypothetical protein